jgi:hypothetical protein
MHVTDMLDPAFAYERRLPASDDGPSRDNIQRDRYRVVWDVAIDGRLSREDPSPVWTQAREARWQEFALTFSMLGDGCRRAFEAWFENDHPSHAAMAAFAITPAGEDSRGDRGRCPLCRFPVTKLDTRANRMSAAASAEIRDHHPSWTIDQGLCAQCLDLYESLVVRIGRKDDPIHGEDGSTTTQGVRCVRETLPEARSGVGGHS